MRLALVTTTIHVPHALAYIRQFDPGVRFFVVGDKNTPQAAYDFADTIPNCVAIRPSAQTDWKCSELIGWNCIQRRNIGFLEALRWGADAIVSWDTDNIPLNHSYFRDFRNKLISTHSGMEGYSSSDWFDVGCLLTPEAPHRGFPPSKTAIPRFQPILCAPIGVAAGICLGDPDVSAVTRIARGPIVHQYSELLKEGVIVDPYRTWTVFNSQNTAFLRELAPAFFMFPGVGRFDDIYASLVVQRVMRDTRHYTCFGAPFIWQQRNPHDYLRDLQEEITGMRGILKFADILDGCCIAGLSVLDAVAALLDTLARSDALPESSVVAGHAWFQDIAGVL